MAKNAEYIRLTEHAQHGCQVDIDTGWGVTGKDVRQVPDNPAIQSYVRNGINRGVFEEASKAEWDEVHDEDGDINDLDNDHRVIMVADKGLPENKIRHKLNQNLANKAANASDEDDSDDVVASMDDDAVKAELSNRGLATTGATRTLKSRLRKALEADEDGGTDSQGGDGS